MLECEQEQKGRIMIDEIRVKNLALIKDADIRPAPGLTVITGETGTGKTALLSSCKLLMGERSDKSLVREGETDASVQGRFFADRSNGPDADLFSGYEDELVISRKVSSDGRSRVQINGEMASVGELSQLVSPMVDLCSQHDQQKLLRPAEQRRLLDTWIGTNAEQARIEYEEAFQSAERAYRRLSDIRMQKEADTGSLEDARFLLSEIDALDPSVEDYEELLVMLDKAENAEALATQSEYAYSAMSAENGILDQMAAAISALENAEKYDPSLKGHVDSLREASFIVEDVSRDIASYKDSMDFCPETLEQNQERVANYQRIMRKYGPELSDVFNKAQEARQLVEIAENADDLEKEALAELEMAEALLIEKAGVLSEVRQDASVAFGESVSSVMSQLEMGSSMLDCHVYKLDRSQWTLAGPDKVEFMFKPSQNMQSRPLSRIASGGELSRVMLSLHAVMGDKDSVSTLIFDEIDAGVGGKTARALAEVLSCLSHTHQVIAVTHLAQVAALADKHYVVDKHEVKGVVETSIDDVSGSSRVEEIARMLSGDVTEASLAHARELLNV